MAISGNLRVEAWLLGERPLSAGPAQLGCLRHMVALSVACRSSVAILGGAGAPRSDYTGCLATFASQASLLTIHIRSSLTRGCGSHFSGVLADAQDRVRLLPVLLPADLHGGG